MRVIGQPPLFHVAGADVIAARLGSPERSDTKMPLGRPAQPNDKLTCDCLGREGRSRL